MVKRVEVISKILDARAEVRKMKLQSMGFNVSDVKLMDVYSVEELDGSLVDRLGTMLTNPVTQNGRVGQLMGITPSSFDYAVEIGFLPGVKDNVGDTAREIAEDFSGQKLNGQGVYSSQVMFVSGEGLSQKDAERIGWEFANPVIQNVRAKSHLDYIHSDGMDESVPKVRLHEGLSADLVELLNATDEELAIIGKQGVLNSDGTRRGPPAMDIRYMKSVQGYFRNKGRNPTDVEFESIAQTWSEHCRHTIFADPIDEIVDGLFKHFIRRATEDIRKAKGDSDFCVSVFSDNAGGIVFDNDYLVCDKAETHNSPSALDPFGGAITGIVGVNRDPMGFGMGAKPIINRFGFCFARQKTLQEIKRGYETPIGTAAAPDLGDLYKDKERKQKMLSSKRILEGVIEGVNVGGNCSGIPTPQGFVYFDDCYRGKPLVFVGTVGLIPREVDGRKMHEKSAEHGDYIVMLGGRVGKDGIHGATFSSEAIDSGSPATAVQIGDPITQKKMSDALIKEARDKGLYRSITDNGAGGLSCSVAEMAKESGGCHVYLDKVSLKYPGLSPWEIWVSESQERMTLSVPPEKWNEFNDLMKRRGVEATVIGEFTNSGECVVDYNGNNVMNVDMEFLHNGMPPRPMKTTFNRRVHEEPEFECLDDLTSTLHKMLGRQNIASFEFISNQYDHEVQGGSVIKPLQGRGRVNGDATVVRPRLDSDKALVLSHGINPSYSEIDTYDMAACAIDTAVRNAVCAGADLEHLALLDNFCWCSSNDPERLGQLKRACEACYDYATIFGAPFISGKDSMFNDFKGFDENGNPVNISVLPTLLISAISVVDDARKSVSIDAKVSGDLVYVLGVTWDQLGGSEYYAMKGEEIRGKKYIGNKIPTVLGDLNRDLYKSFYRAVQEGLVASAISVNRGGLGITLAKTAIAGQLGIEADLDEVSRSCTRNDNLLFSESQGRIVVTINPEYRERFEEIVGSSGSMYSLIGKVRDDDKFILKGKDGNVVNTDVGALSKSYKSTFRSF